MSTRKQFFNNSSNSKEISECSIALLGALGSGKSGMYFVSLLSLSKHLCFVRCNTFARNEKVQIGHGSNVYPRSFSRNGLLYLYKLKLQCNKFPHVLPHIDNHLLIICN